VQRIHCLKVVEQFSTKTKKLFKFEKTWNVY
jgi:hypothetical protein